MFDILRIARGVSFAIAAATALQGCSLDTLKGTRGLPPAPENLAYPSVYAQPAPRGTRLKTPEEQRRLKAELQALKARIAAKAATDLPPE
jgi:hypothetical protein